MTYPFGQTVTLVTRTKTGVDTYGDDLFTETQLSFAAVFAPGGSTETLQGGDTVVTQPTLYDVPPTVHVTAGDAVIVAGQRFEVDGDPASGWLSPFTGWQPGTVVRLRRVTG